MAAAGTPWQFACETVEQSCGYLLKSGQWSDCTFKVGSETKQVIQAHKLVLAMASPVFEAMFYGGLSERNDSVVSITDVQPEAFRALLQYIYTGFIRLSSFDMATDLWYAARKYMLPQLEKQCTSHISLVVGPRNACRAYEFACLFEENTIEDKCIQIISTNTKEVLNDDTFVDVELNTLIKVCSLDHLNVDSELDLFHAVARYAKAKQRRQEQNSPPVEGGPSSDELSVKVFPSVESSSETKRTKENLKQEEHTIRAALQQIRFLSLTSAEFAEGPARSGLLTKDETLAVFMNMAKDSPVPMPPGFSECRERRQPRSDLQKNERCIVPGSLEDTIIKALKCGDPSQVKRAAVAAVDMLRTPLSIQPAGLAGMLDALVPALTEGSYECKEHAIRAIYRLCSRSSPAQLRLLAASAVLQPFCSLLNDGGGTGYLVLRGLIDLLKRGEQTATSAVVQQLRAIGVPQLLTVRLGGYREDEFKDLLQTYFDNNQ